MDEEDRLTDGPSGRGAPKRRARPAASARQEQQVAAHAEGPDEHAEDTSAGESIASMTDNEFRLMLEETNIQSVLPTLPRMPGFHCFWATTKSSQDTVAARRRLGYEFVTPEMVPGWSSQNIVTGENGPTIMVNEMVAMRLPSRRYDILMRHFHHDQPIAQEGSIRATIERLTEGAEARGGRIEEGDGMAAFGSKAPRPSFAPD